MKKKNTCHFTSDTYMQSHFEQSFRDTDLHICLTENIKMFKLNFLPKRLHHKENFSSVNRL